MLTQARTLRIVDSAFGVQLLEWKIFIICLTELIKKIIFLNKSQKKYIKKKRLQLTQNLTQAEHVTLREKYFEGAKGCFVT